ncbi:MAG: hypothetical protein KGJ37_05775, partial [Verrucomicrobiota bacterium]|nr:hypothetical protein [Verrucomicrobiota bacterium]
FDRRGDEFVFEPSELYIGSLPVHRLPVLPGLLMKKILSSQQIPENLTAAWKKLRDVKITGDQLMLSLAK